MLRCVVAKYKQAIFVDQFFQILTAILNGFIWFGVFVLIAVFLINRITWPTNRALIFKLTENQDLAIYYIRLARAFMEELKDKKSYDKKDRGIIAVHLENLSVQFNNFRGTQPMIMDSLLETMDSLRLMQKK